MFIKTFCQYVAVFCPSCKNLKKFSIIYKNKLLRVTIGIRRQTAKQKNKKTKKTIKKSNLNDQKEGRKASIS